MVARARLGGAAAAAGRRRQQAWVGGEAGEGGLGERECGVHVVGGRGRAQRMEHCQLRCQVVALALPDGVVSGCCLRTVPEIWSRVTRHCNMVLRQACVVQTPQAATPGNCPAAPQPGRFVIHEALPAVRPSMHSYTKARRVLIPSMSKNTKQFFPTSNPSSHNFLSSPYLL